MNNSYCIGIDLGTTYSCVGIYRNNKVEIIPNELGNNTTPCYITFMEDENIIGEFSKTQIDTHPLNTIYGIKRLMGKKFTDNLVQQDLRHFSFKIIDDGNDRPLIKIDNNNKKLVIYPEEFSAMILTKMKKLAENYINDKICNAVITVPAYFNDAQRNATKYAGELAGLNVLRIINEPTAAAIAYGLDKNYNNNNKYILVFDLGGGTLDISLLSIEDNIFMVKATCGDTHLGGEDFDNKIIEYCLMEFSKKMKLSINQIKELLLNPKIKSKLKKEAEIAKKHLSNTNQVIITIENFYNNTNLVVQLTRTKFEILCENEFKKCLIPIQQVLDDSQINKNDIFDIVLIGGSTRIPKIRQILRDYFNKEPKIDINPDEAVAYGATIQCANLNNLNNLNQIILIDVIPLSLGIETVGGIMTTIIPKNTIIPFEMEKTFSTYSDNQPYITIKVFEGEKVFVKDNNLLGTFDLEIAPALRNIPKIVVKFYIDSNGILNVSATDLTTNKQQKITISNRLTLDYINKMQYKNDLCNDIDNKIKENIENKYKLEKYLNSIKNLLLEYKNILDSEIYINLFNKINNLLILCNKNNNDLNLDLNLEYNKIKIEIITVINNIK